MKKYFSVRFVFLFTIFFFFIILSVSFVIQNGNKSILPAFGHKSGSVSISVFPSEANIYIGTEGPFQGSVTKKLLPGSYEVFFYAPNYTSKSIVLSVSKPGELVTISETLEPIAEPIVFLPLSNDVPALSFWSNTDSSYYVYKTDIRNGKDGLLQARLKTPILFASWSSGGVAALQTQNETFLFIPPHKTRRIFSVSTKAFVSPNGTTVVYQGGAAVFMSDIKDGAVFPPSSLFSLNNNEVVSAIQFSPSGEKLVLFISSSTSTRAVFIDKNSKNSKELTALAGGVSLVGSFDFSGSSFALVEDEHIKVFSLSSLNDTKIVKRTEAKTRAQIVPHKLGFLVFEESHFNEGLSSKITKISYLFPPFSSLAHALFDAPLVKRTDISYQPLSVFEDGCIVRDSAGGFFYLGNPSSLPKSLFDSPLPVGENGNYSY